MLRESLSKVTGHTICLEKVSINWRLNSNICYMISVYICVLDMITWTNWWKDELRDICSLLRILIWLIICISWECSMFMQNAILLHGYWLPNVSHVDAFTLDLLKVLWPSCFLYSQNSQETFGSLLFTGDLRVIHRWPSGHYYHGRPSGHIQETFGSNFHTMLARQPHSGIYESRGDT